MGPLTSALSPSNKFSGKDFSLFSMRARAFAQQHGFLIAMDSAQQWKQSLDTATASGDEDKKASLLSLNHSLASFLVSNLDDSILKFYMDQVPTAEEFDGNAMWCWLKSKYSTPTCTQRPNPSMTVLWKTKSASWSTEP
jgi:hypothetical protein